MKKMMMFAAAILCAAVTQAATIGWTNAGLTNYKGDAYMIFVIGQKGVASQDAVVSLLGKGSDVSNLAFGSGTVAANGAATVLPANSTATLDPGTYTSFLVVFDAATPVSGKTNYALLSGIATQTLNIGSTTAIASFGTGGQATFWNNAANWKSYGPTGGVPEPTSGLLLLVGGAMLALRRKQK